MAASNLTFSESLQKFGPLGRVIRWLEATPHPPVALEVLPEQVAGVRFSRTGALDGFAVEALPPGALAASAIESNLLNPPVVKAAITKVAERLRAKDEDVALLLPDPVIRVFVQHFDDFPRSSDEAIPMLRWKLKKSVPFEVDETLLSYMRQTPRADGVDVRLAVLRQQGDNARPLAGVHKPGHRLMQAPQAILRELGVGHCRFPCVSLRQADATMGRAADARERARRVGCAATKLEWP